MSERIERILQSPQYQLAHDLDIFFCGFDGNEQGMGRAVELINKLPGTGIHKKLLLQDLYRDYGNTEQVEELETRHHYYSTWPENHNIAITPNAGGELSLGICTKNGVFEWEKRGLLDYQLRFLEESMRQAEKDGNRDPVVSRIHFLQAYIQQFEEYYNTKVTNLELLSTVYGSAEDMLAAQKMFMNILDYTG